MRVPGSFQDRPWDFVNAPQMTKAAIDEGTLWSYTTPIELPAGFYEYKYLVDFGGGHTRIVSDPCTRYGGFDSDNAAVVVGGSPPSANEVRPLAHGRRPINAAVITAAAPKINVNHEMRTSVREPAIASEFGITSPEAAG